MMPGRQCLDCSKALSPRGKSIRCVACSNRERASHIPPLPPLTCSSCGVPIRNYKRRKGTMCRPCTGRHACASPKQREAARRTSLARWADPAARALLIDRMKLAQSTPEMRAHHSALGKANAHKVAHNVVTPAGSPTRKKAAQSVRNRINSWCPPEHRAFYRRLIDVYGYRAAQAREIVTEQIARDRLEVARRPKSFEDQLAAVRAGAKVVKKFVAPKPEPLFTLGGSVGEIG